MFQPAPSGSCCGSRKVRIRFCWYCESMPNHSIGASSASDTATTPATAAVPTHHHDSPASSSANTPLAAISIAVPKSGCRRISAVGIAISTADPSTVPIRGGSGRWCRYQATIIGRLIFSSSEGCR